MNTHHDGDRRQSPAEAGQGSPAPSSGHAWEEGLVRLLQLAGPRTRPPDARTAAVRAVAHDAWREAIARRARRRKTLLAGGVLAAAATVLLAVRLIPSDRSGVSPSPGSPLTVGSITAVNGGAEVGSWQVDAGAVARALVIGEPLTAGAIVRTASGGRAALVLVTGVELRADVATAIRLVAPNEVELLAGAVYVDTREPGDATRGGSLAVRTPVGLVTDIGTRFETRMSDDRLRVRVRDGIVRVQQGAWQHVSAAGHEVTVGANHAIEEHAIAPYGPEWNWVFMAAPGFVLEGRALRTFLEWVEREGGWTVVFADEQVRAAALDTTLHGSIAGLTPGEALQVVLPTCNLAHRLEEGRVVIERAGAETNR